MLAIIWLFKKYAVFAQVCDFHVSYNKTAMSWISHVLLLYTYNVKKLKKKCILFEQVLLCL